MTSSLTKQNTAELVVSSHSNVAWRWPTLLALLAVQLWLAHAVVFFPHEYAHTFTAWLLGWKANPLDLHFPPLTPIVWLLQLGINQNVNEAPIFASGHGPDAALIGGAGMVLGNALLTLPLSRLGWQWATKNHRAGWALFAYWCTAASIGNLLDYVPVRTFTLGGDMGALQRGFGWSPWLVLGLLGVPTLVALVWFFGWVVPASLKWVFPQNPAQRFLVAALTVGAMFGFYGAVGFLEGGPIAHALSVISVVFILPLLLVVELVRLRRVHPVPDPATK